MPDEKTHHKVVSIFQKHLKGELPSADSGEFILSPDGFSYISLRQDCLDDDPNEEDLIHLAAQKHYIIKILEHHQTSFRVNNYHVPGTELERFLLSLAKRPGRLLEIKPFFPDTTA